MKLNFVNQQATVCNRANTTATPLANTTDETTATDTTTALPTNTLTDVTDSNHRGGSDAKGIDAHHLVAIYHPPPQCTAKCVICGRTAEPTSILLAYLSPLPPHLPPEAHRANICACC